MNLDLALLNFSSDHMGYSPRMNSLTLSHADLDAKGTTPDCDAAAVTWYGLDAASLGSAGGRAAEVPPLCCSSASTLAASNGFTPTMHEAES